MGAQCYLLQGWKENGARYISKGKALITRSVPMGSRVSYFRDRNQCSGCSISDIVTLGMRLLGRDHFLSMGKVYHIQKLTNGIMGLFHECQYKDVVMQ